MFKRKLLWRLGLPLLAVVLLVAAIVLWPERPNGEQMAGEWTCSMHPQIRKAGPGRCPLCGMNLVPVTQLSELAESEKRAGIETEEVTYRELFKEVGTVGKLDYNESRVAYIAARIAGRVDRIYADFTGIHVNQGDHLVDIYSPELFVAQGELLRSLEAFQQQGGDRSFAEANLESARAKLRLLGILPEQLREIESSRKSSTHLTIYAPIGGTVIEKNVRVGQYVKEGDMLYRIADLDPIWLYLDVYEYDLGWIRFGQPVEVTVEAYPAEVIRGTVSFIDPFLDDKTRTIRVRVNLRNPDRRLKPAMYASALVRVRLLPDGTPEPTGLEGKYVCPMHPDVVREGPGRCDTCEMPLERVPETPRPAPEDQADHPQIFPSVKERGRQPPGVLAIRSTAVLDTGRRKITYRRNESGVFELVALKLGPLAEGKDDAGNTISYFPVLRGLRAGDHVVIRGGFLLDSQQQISGMPSLLFEQGQAGTKRHAGHAPAPPGPADPGDHRH